MALHGKKCPRTGLRVKSADGATGTVTKVETPSGKKACDSGLVYVKLDVGGSIVGLPRTELKKTSLKGKLGSLGVEWTGKRPLLVDEEEADRTDDAFRVVPQVEVERKPAWASGFFRTGILFKDINPALTATDADDVPVPEWNDLSQSYVTYPNTDKPRMRMWRREDLQRILAAEDHYRGIMPAETQFKGLGDVFRVTNKEGRTPPEWIGAGVSVKPGDYLAADGEISIARSRFKTTADVERMQDEHFRREAAGWQPSHAQALRGVKYVSEQSITLTKVKLLTPDTRDRTKTKAKRGTLHLSVNAREEGRRPVLYMKRAPWVSTRGWYANDLTSARLQRLSEGKVTQLFESDELYYQVDDPADQQALSVWLTRVLEHGMLPSPEAGAIDRVTNWLDSVGLRGTDAEHATEFQHARHEALTAANDAKQALQNGQCLTAGTLIDDAYVNYGRAQANATDAQQMSEAARLHRAIRTVDEPFERKCVRSEPVSDLHERSMSMMRPGLAGSGVGSDAHHLAKLIVGAWVGAEESAYQVRVEPRSTTVMFEWGSTRTTDNSHNVSNARLDTLMAELSKGSTISLVHVIKNGEYRPGTIKLKLLEDSRRSLLVALDYWQQQGWVK